MGKIDMTGWIMKEHGVLDSKLIVLEEDKQYKIKNNIVNNSPYWRCKCECGTIFTTNGQSIRKGITKSCGCYKKERMKQVGKNNSNQDLIGKKFNYLLVIKEDLDYKKKNQIKNNSSYWLCKCDCGNIVTVRRTHLTNGTIKSCGCLQREKTKETNIKDITGLVFGKLTAIKRLNEKEGASYLWECQCKCGNICAKNISSLISGKALSCGCLKSKGEMIIQMLLEKNNIPFIKQYSFETCVNSNTNHKLFFDFYINDSFLLEYDGEQHFNFSGRGWNTKQHFESLKERDQIKNNWCKTNKIPLKRISYRDLDTLTIEDILSDKYLLDFQ